MLNKLDKITWCLLAAIFAFGAATKNDSCLIVGLLGLLMYSLYISLSEQIKELKDSEK